MKHLLRLVLAIAVGSPGNLGNLLELLNFSDSTNTGAFLTQFTLPADPFSVAIGSGVAFVADGTAGLQVVNYLSFDNKGVAPTVTVNTTGMDVDSTKPGIQVVEGSLVPVPVQVFDDVQVRNVELLVNGQVVQNDVTFPFDFKAPMPTLASGATTATVQVRATDTGGNIGLSPLITLALVRDTIAPALASVDPVDGSAHGLSFRTVTLGFSEPIDPSTATAANIKLSGPSGAILPETIQFPKDGVFVRLTYPLLAIGTYQVVIVSSAIKDRAGNALGTADVTISFTIRQEPTVIPYRDLGYRYLIVAYSGNAGFEQTTFDDSSFAIGDAGFGQGGSCPLSSSAVTVWPGGTDMLLRKHFLLAAGATNLRVGAAIDNDIQVFVNGIDISGGLRSHENCASLDSFVFNAPNSILHVGDNILAVRARDRGGVSYVDVKVTVDWVAPPSITQPAFHSVADASASGRQLETSGDGAPPIRNVTRTADGLNFQFSTLAGRRYRLEGSADLVRGSWEVLIDNIEGAGIPLQVIDLSIELRASGLSGTGTRQYFYRIILLP